MRKEGITTMCGLFGFTIYGNNPRNYSRLLNALAQGASERGTHATGIAYNRAGHLAIYKRPLPAKRLCLNHREGVRVVMGHTRHTTQGSQKRNYNNHPFRASAGVDFALAHNGIIYNDDELRVSEHLPASYIETDSYILAQLLERFDHLDADTLADSVEKLSGYYTFTLVDSRDTLYIVKGESPLAIARVARLGLIVYASTQKILDDALKTAGIDKRDCESIDIAEGEILAISRDGKLTRSRFKMPARFDYLKWIYSDSYDFDDSHYFATTSSAPARDESDEHYKNLCIVARYYGYDTDDIDSLLDDGFTLDEIEEYFFS